MMFRTLPLVRRVGGLADTIVDCSLENLVHGAATGFASYLRDSCEEPREHEVRHVGRYMR
ncbi:hypothetical protein D1006_33155 [Burkholderia stabilis]|uniref:Uncharacterized protein n=1 Tax=Burkholderia stabilis TaxID=95485 RepID=A0A4Q2A7C0_9BURK|nr:hypothetical protein D1006_33155 [Burkholderia stabilis]